MKHHIHILARAIATGALIITLSGCAQLSAAASGVNWYKIGAYACLRLSDTLNDKADEKDKELQKAAQEQAEQTEAEQTQTEE